MRSVLMALLEPPLLSIGWAWWTWRCRTSPRRRPSEARELLRRTSWPLEQAIAGGRPVVLGDVFERWPTLRLWTPDHLARALAGVSVDVLLNEKGEPGFLDSFLEQRTERMSLGQLVNRLREANRKERYYLAGTGLDALGPLLGELDLPVRVAGRALFPPGSGLWMGEAGNITDLHYDVWHGLLVQLTGRKRVTLFEPDQAALVYPESPFGSRSGWCSRLPSDLGSTDLKRFPAFERAAPIRGVVGPGDALYIPPGFWHHVESLDATMSLSIRYRPRWLEFLRPYVFPVRYGFRYKGRISTAIRALRSIGTGWRGRRHAG